VGAGLQLPHSPAHAPSLALTHVLFKSVLCLQVELPVGAGLQLPHDSSGRGRVLPSHAQAGGLILYELLAPAFLNCLRSDANITRSPVRLELPS
jgi:hypothetical protein